MSQHRQMAQRIVEWQALHGRHDLPWQRCRDPYRIWLSEIMLQQTQVATVIPYFENFLLHFPNIQSLAKAELDEVMVLWAGLGYYRRAHYLHQCAQEINQHWQGQFPADIDQLATLPGIGPTTAAAIAAQAFGIRAPILDGNVKRVLSRLFAVDAPVNLRATEKQLWQHAHDIVDAADKQLDMRAYTQGMMDLGATVCRRSQPNCLACPLSQCCQAYQQGRQNELPQRQRRKPLPRRRCTMLILTDGSHILLQRQPDTGLWSNLWSLPEVETAPELNGTLKKWHPAQQLCDLTLPAIEHTFTHFRLTIQPVVVYWPLSAPPSGVAHTNRHWLPVSRLSEVALPAPVKKLLADYAQQKASGLIRFVEADNDECS